MGGRVSSSIAIPTALLDSTHKPQHSSSSTSSTPSGTMDYSTTPAGDSDHLAGASPWATSPNPDRTSFDHPTSPLPPQSPYAEIAEHESQGFAAERPPPDSPEQSLATSKVSENGSEGPTSPTSPTQHHPQQPQQRGQSDQSRNQERQRYRPRQNAPQHKLQAKVTGLERTGRKDPILRFDVYVRGRHEYS